MSRRNRYQIRNAQQKVTERAPQWYATNGFKIGAGIAAIVILLVLIVSLNKLMSPTPAGNDQGTAENSVAAPPSSPVNTEDAQVIRMAVTPSQYMPSTLTVEAGKPVKWIVDGTQASGCTRYLISSDFGISKKIASGENLIEFTPTKKGTFGFSCGMGMVRGTMNVV